MFIFNGNYSYPVIVQGDRVGNLTKAITLLHASGVHVDQLSRLYESAPAHVTDQPDFINAAALVRSSFTPHDLLDCLKNIESRLGREASGLRWGPRTMDLDIIFYEDVLHIDKEGGTPPSRTLSIPHPLWQERNFVVAPLADLSVAPEQCPAVSMHLEKARNLWHEGGGEAMIATNDLRCVVPLANRGVLPWSHKTLVMGIVNATPDSFSDGGDLNDAGKSTQELIRAGADVIDIGGQSTRPGAQLLSAAEEAARVIPIIKSLSPCTKIPISVDTFYAEVAAAAIEAGADIVNDVSGGTRDPRMLSTVAASRASFILMHSPVNDFHENSTVATDIVDLVASDLAYRAEAALDAGIEPWRLILDPGIGFGKTARQNIELLAGLRRLKELLGNQFGKLPLLVGPSRKRFLGEITGRQRPKERDVATAVAVALSAAPGGANIVRVHNVPYAVDACRVADTFYNSTAMG